MVQAFRRNEFGQSFLTKLAASNIQKKNAEDRTECRRQNIERIVGTPLRDEEDQQESASNRNKKKGTVGDGENQQSDSAER